MSLKGRGGKKGRKYQRENMYMDKVMKDAKIENRIGIFSGGGETDDCPASCMRMTRCYVVNRKRMQE